MIGVMLINWEAVVLGGKHWIVREHGGYRVLAIDITAFWRPALKGCRTKHYNQQAGKALPVMVFGIIGRVGQIGKQQLLLPLGFLRADPDKPNEGGLVSGLIVKAKAIMQPKDALVSDGGFPLKTILAHGIPRFVAKLPRNCTARRFSPPKYSGKGRPPSGGRSFAPLARSYKGKTLPATSPDRSETWEEEGRTIRADIWDNLVLTSTKADEFAQATTFSIMVFHDPNFTRPLVIAVNLMDIAARHARLLYLDRWPVEQLPLAAKQMIGAHRAFVHADESCHRLPELALLAGSTLSFVAAALPAVPTGFWDRKPQPTPGRLLRFLSRWGFPTNFGLPPPKFVGNPRSQTTCPRAFWGIGALNRRSTLKSGTNCRFAILFCSRKRTECFLHVSCWSMLTAHRLSFSGN